MFSSHVHAVSHIHQPDRKGLIWLVVFKWLQLSFVYLFLNSLSLLYCCDIYICMLLQVKNNSLGIHCRAAKRFPNIGKSVTDVGSFLCLCNSLFLTATLDSIFSSSFINNPFWSWVTSVGFFKQLIESAILALHKVKWFGVLPSWLVMSGRSPLLLSTNPVLAHN